MTTQVTEALKVLAIIATVWS